MIKLFNEIGNFKDSKEYLRLIAEDEKRIAELEKHLTKSKTDLDWIRDR